MKRLVLHIYILFMALTAMACQSNEVEATPSDKSASTMNITINGKTISCQLVENSSTRALLAQLEKGNITYEADDYGNFEKVGYIGFNLPQNNESITTTVGDVILYQGNNICLYYGSNSWSFTRLGKIEGMSKDEIKTFLNAGEGSVKVTLSAATATRIKQTLADRKVPSGKYSLDGRKLKQTPSKGVYIEIAFDPSFTGESSGEPRRTASPDINTEDFLAAVDYLSMRDDVDTGRIAIIGICGWGGIALNAAAQDPRIKATAAMTMYDMSRVNGNGYFDADDSEESRYSARKAWAEARTADLRNRTFTMAGGVVDPLPENAPQFVKDYYAYYKTPRGYHKRSGNSNDGWRTTGCQAYANTRFLYYINEIRSAVLIVHGEKAHSRYFGENAFRYMVDGKAEGYDFARKPNPVPANKQLLIIPGASHCDLYDGGEKGMIPWDNIEEFLKKNLNNCFK